MTVDKDIGRARKADERLEPIDVLRALAAMAVMGFHHEAMAITLLPDIPQDALNLRYGVLGVELFFIISGFVILRTIERSRSARSFLIGRAARVYPAYWLSVIVSAVILLSTHNDVLTRAAINLTMLQSFVLVPGLIPPYWTLAYELWFYVLMAGALRFGLIGRLPGLACAWLVAASIVRAFGLHSYGLPGILSMLPFGHLFIAGMMLHFVASGRSSGLVLLVLLWCLGYSAFGREDWTHVSGTIYFVCTAVFLSAVYLASAGRLRFIVHGWLVDVGQASYSLYLLHFPIGLLCVLVARQYGCPNWVGIVIAIPLAFAAALLSRRFIEIPGQQAIKSLDREKLQRPALP